MNNYRSTIILPIFNQFDLANECLMRLIKFSGSEFRIIIVDDASTVGDFFEQFPENSLDNLIFIRNVKNLGFVGSVNIAFSITNGENIAIVNSDVFVSDKWLEILTEELDSSELIGTVTAMATKGSVATVQLQKRDLLALSPLEIDNINTWLGTQRNLTMAYLPSAVGHCMLIRGEVLNLVGDFSNEFSPGYGEEVDFSLRAIAMGFQHRLSSRVLVWHKNSASFGESNPNKTAHEKLLNKKYPSYAQYVSNYEDRNELAINSFLRVLTKQFGIRILIDGRSLSGGLTGTFVVIREILEKFSENENYSAVYILIPSGFDSKTLIINDKIKLVTTDKILKVLDEIGKFDFVLRPSQVNNYATLQSLWDYAERVVIWQLDYISFFNWFYHISNENFRQFQDSNLLALNWSDGYIFNSNFVYRESLNIGSRRQLDGTTIVSENGINHIREEKFAENNAKHVLILGVAFQHKNRVYALRIADELQKRMVDFKFIFVGSFPDSGSSRFLEDSFINENSHIRKHVEFTNWLSEAELEEIWKKTSLALFPSVSEGFGLVPLEAARRGIPSIYSCRSSLEYNGNTPPFTLTLKNLKTDVDIIQALLTNEQARYLQWSHLKKISDNYTWEKVFDSVNSLIFNILENQPRSYKVLRNQYFDSRRQKYFFIYKLANFKFIKLIFPRDSIRRNFLISIYKKIN